MKEISKFVSLLIILSITFLFYACGDNIMSPSPSDNGDPPPPTTTIPPPPHDPGVDFSWHNTRGILVFPGTQATTPQIQALDNRLHMAGWPTVTYNTCSEVEAWNGTPWADSDAGAFSRENLDNLRNFLKTTAELGSQVKLNIFCTLRDNHGWMENETVRNINGKQKTGKNVDLYTEAIAIIAKDYNHVNLSIANEPYHSNSWFKNNLDRMRRVRDVARIAGFQGPMGADDNIGCSGCSFEYQYRILGFTPEFHPYRNPDPSKNALRRIVDVNGLPVAITESTAYSKWRKPPKGRENGWCCTDNKDQILRYMRNAEAEGITWFYHSTSGLMWPKLEEHFEWIPPGK